jgi:hypothetical protein
VHDDDRKTLPVSVGGRPTAVIRLRGWERYACLGFSVAAVLAGVLSLAKLLGASIGGELIHDVEVILGATALAAVAGFALAMRRYEGETTEPPRSWMKRLASRSKSD